MSRFSACLLWSVSCFSYDFTTDDDNGKYKRPKRESTHPPPQFAKQAMAAELKTIIMKHYASSAFNRCTTQKLPMMEGEPLIIPIKDGIRPTVNNKPITVPFYWWEQIEADLETNVHLGVIKYLRRTHLILGIQG